MNKRLKKWLLANRHYLSSVEGILVLRDYGDEQDTISPWTVHRWYTGKTMPYQVAKFISGETGIALKDFGVPIKKTTDVNWIPHRMSSRSRERMDAILTKYLIFLADGERPSKARILTAAELGVSLYTVQWLT